MKNISANRKSCYVPTMLMAGYWWFYFELLSRKGIFELTPKDA